MFIIKFYTNNLVSLIFGNCQDCKDGKSRRGKREKSSSEQDQEEAPKGYIHVRARRGQATDSHSLAERVCTAHQTPHTYTQIVSCHLLDLDAIYLSLGEEGEDQ